MKPWWQSLKKIPALIGYLTIIFLLYITVGGSSPIQDSTNILDDISSKLNTITSETPTNQNEQRILKKEDRIVGTWELNSQGTLLKYLFNSDGTGTFFSPLTGEHYFTYYVENDKIILDDGVIITLVKDDAFIQNVGNIEFTFKKTGSLW